MNIWGLTLGSDIFTSLLLINLDKLKKMYLYKINFNFPSFSQLK